MKTAKENRNEVRHRDYAVTISMNKDEREELFSVAKEARMSVSCFARIAMRKYIRERRERDAEL